MNQQYVLTGSSINSLEEFYDSIGELLLPNDYWGKNLDALHDILSGGFNIPKSPFELVWKDYNHTKNSLGYAATIEWYQSKVEFFQEDAENLEYYSRKLEEARLSKGETLYDGLFQILSDNSTDVEFAENDIKFKM
jgi:RNAse (barnase) inhibitor barstar